MMRRVSAFASAGAAVAALFASAALAPSPRSPDAPLSFSRPQVERAGSAGDAVQVGPQAGAWGSQARGSPTIRFRYSWLACDLKGRHCAPLSGFDTQRIVPPQELKIVTLRGVVTATNRYGSTSVVTSNFYYDMAGYPFHDLRFVRRYPQSDPVQLRTWYGLRPGQDGAGQTIVIPDFGRVRGLRAAVDHFSTHYGLPRPCRGARSRGCFRLVLSHAGGRPSRVNPSGEAELDVEWAHAIAPDARIVFVQFDHAASLFDKIGWLALAGHASVVSDSWCDPCQGFAGFARGVVYPHVKTGCHWPHLVCVQASGDRGSPGDEPANSPYVLAVGGTRFTWNRDGSIAAEAYWPHGGYGVTDVPLTRPAWQTRARECRLVPDLACVQRAIPDVSATAAGAPVFLPTEDGPEWFHFNGTSLSTPLWAALIALADQELARHGQRPMGIDALHHVLYRGYVAAGLDAIDHPGWDPRTGWGSPRAGIVDALTHAIERYRRERCLACWVAASD